MARGNSDSARFYRSNTHSEAYSSDCFRPVLEVINSAAPAAPVFDSLKAMPLDLDGGTLGTNDNIKIVYMGVSFTAPTAEGITAPTGKVFDKWLGSDGNTYAHGADVPYSVTGLTAQWIVPPTTHTIQPTAKPKAEVKEVQSFARFGSKVQGFKDGWDGVKRSINVMKPGDCKEIVMASHVKLVPRSVVETIKGKDVTITFISGSDKWKVNGKDIKAAKSFHIDRMS